MSSGWHRYQEEAAAFFRELGMDAATNVRLEGVRTTHDIDVVVRGRYSGFDILWVVECKHWQTPVTKLHVLALREIVADLGADRGILLAERGFQSGAGEAAHLTNVQLTSLSALADPAETQIYAVRVLELYDRIEACRVRYWSIDKRDRIKFGLRPEVGVYGYSAQRLIDLGEDLVTKAMRGVFPVHSPDSNLLFRDAPDTFASLRELHNTVLEIIEDVERRLTLAERALED